MQASKIRFLQKIYEVMKYAKANEEKLFARCLCRGFMLELLGTLSKQNAVCIGELRNAVTLGCCPHNTKVSEEKRNIQYHHT